MKKGIVIKDISHFDTELQEFLRRSGVLDGKHYGIYEDGEIIGHIVNDKFAGIEISFYFENQNVSFLKDLIPYFSHINFIKGERSLKAILTEGYEMKYGKYFEEAGFKLKKELIKDFKTKEDLFFGESYTLDGREFYENHPEMLQELKSKNPKLAEEIDVNSRLSNTSFKKLNSIKKYFCYNTKNLI